MSLDLDYLVDDPAEQAFREERRKGIGGSDVAAILGLDDYSTPTAVWLEKLGRHPDSGRMNEAMLWGRLQEPLIVDQVCIRRGYEPAGQVFSGSHPEHAWMRANLDSLLIDEVNPDRSLGILECKTTSVWQAGEWRDGETPAPALLQWMWYAAVTGLEWGAIAGLVGGQKLEIIDIKPDAELIDMLIDRCGEFWHDHVIPRRPPPATGRDTRILEAVYDIAADARRSLEELPPTDVAMVLELVEHYRRLRRLSKAIEDRKDQTKADLQQWLGERGIEVLEFTPTGKKKPSPLVSWRRGKPRRPHNCPNCDHPIPDQGNRVCRVTTVKEL